MNHEQYQPHNQDNVNEASSHVKCEEPKQPKNDQNCGDYPKHFHLLDVERAIICDLILRNCSDASSHAGERCSDMRLGVWKTSFCPIVNTLAFYFRVALPPR